MTGTRGRGAWLVLGGLALARIGPGCDENFNDVYIGPQGGSAGAAGADGQVGGSSGSAGQACSACAIGCGEDGCLTIKQASLGGAQSCVILSDDSVRCWGANDRAQLGMGNPSVAERKPVAITTLKGVSAIAMGARHGCALRDGKVLCWGDNGEGQCGTALSTTVQVVPTEVTLPGLVDQVAVGTEHSCARLQDGTVACWGSNARGQLGVDSPVDQSPSPVVVPSLKGVGSLALGGRRSCATLASSEVTCWGEFSLEEKEESTFLPTPQVLTKLTGAQRLSLGEFHLCWEQLPAGTVQCLGSNQSGQLGNGTTTSSESPVSVINAKKSLLIDAGSLAAGARHQCAVRNESGTVGCWGSNASQQLGDSGGNELQDSTVPDVVQASDVACGAEHCCAIAQEDRSLWCWGSNTAGQLARAEGSTNEPDKVVW